MFMFIFQKHGLSLEHWLFICATMRGRRSTSRIMMIKYLVKVFRCLYFLTVCDPCIIFMPLDMAPGWGKRSVNRIILILKFLVPVF